VGVCSALIAICDSLHLKGLLHLETSAYEAPRGALRLWLLAGQAQ